MIEVLRVSNQTRNTATVTPGLCQEISFGCLTIIIIIVHLTGWYFPDITCVIAFIFELLVQFCAVHSERCFDCTPSQSRHLTGCMPSRSTCQTETTTNKCSYKSYIHINFVYIQADINWINENLLILAYLNVMSAGIIKMLPKYFYASIKFLFQVGPFLSSKSPTTLQTL